MNADWCPAVGVNALQTLRHQRTPKTVSSESLYNSAHKIRERHRTSLVVPHATGRAALLPQPLKANSWSRKEVTPIMASLPEFTSTLWRSFLVDPEPLRKFRGSKPRSRGQRSGLYSTLRMLSSFSCLCRPC